MSDTLVFIMKKAKLILGYVSLFPKRNLPFPISHLPPGWGMTKKTEGLNILVDKKKGNSFAKLREKLKNSLNILI